MEVHGTVIGKFLPPHRGHHNLINYATEYCDVLHVIVVDQPYYQAMEDISLEQRLTWLQAIHTSAKIRWYKDSLLDTVPAIDDLWWAQHTVQIIGRYPDFHCSYDYDRDKGYAEAMRAGFLIPPGGTPIRATLIRNDPTMYATYLHPIVRKWYEIARKRKENETTL